MASLEEQWKQRIRGDFPDGVLMTWEDVSESPTYRVARVLVTGMQGDFDPKIRFSAADTPDKCFEYVLVDYEVTRDSPRLVRVTFDSGDSMIWNSNVGAKLAAELRNSEW